MPTLKPTDEPPDLDAGLSEDGYYSAVKELGLIGDTETVFRTADGNPIYVRRASELEPKQRRAFITRLAAKIGRECPLR